jgi:hypothetical protein
VLEKCALLSADDVAGERASLREMFVFTADDFNDALSYAKRQLESVREALDRVACPSIEYLSIGLSDITVEHIKERLDSVPSGYGKKDRENDYVYVIGITSEVGDPATILAEKLEEARKKARDYCRLNEDHRGTHTLYVGRSKKLRGRLGQHLGAESRGVYAMHLQRRAGGTDAEISISYMRFENKDDLLIQAIEDGLWESLRPAFGRKGEQ